MDERNPLINFELSQDTLESAWRDLAEAIVLRGNTPLLMRGEFSPDGIRHPYEFSMQLPETLAQEVLLDEGDIPLRSEALYSTEHRISDEPDDTETYEVVFVGWEYRLPNTNKKASRSLSIARVKDGAQEYLRGTTFVESSELRNGAWRRISNNGYDLTAIDTTEVGSPEYEAALMNAFDDFSASEGELSFDDTEKLHQVAQYIREHL